MNIFETMVEQYHPTNEEERSNAQRETMQKIALAGLKEAAFSTMQLSTEELAYAFSTV